MKMLIVSALVCALMVLTRAAAPPEETPQDETERRLVKRWTDGISGWYSFNGRCYRYISTHMSWARAERNCQSLGGNLASVHSIQENQAIQNVILRATRSNTRAWIGGSDAEKENYWFWSDGTFYNFHHWCHGQPNNYKNNQHCIQMSFSAHKCWDDLPCSDKYPSVCSKERC